MVFLYICNPGRPDKRQAMKNLMLIPVIALLIVSCKSEDKKQETKAMTKEEMEVAKNDTSRFTTIEWIDATTKNLGALKKDQQIEITYRFKNTGKNMLIIEDVIPTCGCTIPEKPQQPFAPGEEGLIKTKFNGSGSGSITKNIRVVANTLPSKDHQLIFTGEIKE